MLESEFTLNDASLKIPRKARCEVSLLMIYKNKNVGVKI